MPLPRRAMVAMPYPHGWLLHDPEFGQELAQSQ
jgi:hypothetical protein